MATIGNLIVNLKANTSKFTKGLNSAKKSLRGLKKQMGGMKGTALKIGGALAVAFGTKAIVNRINSSRQAIDSLAKSSDKLGIATEKLAGLQHVAELTGVSSKALEKGFIRMAVNVSDFADGVGEAKGAFESLNLDAGELINMSPDQQFIAIAKSLESIENPTKKAAVAYEIFGKSGVDLINTMNAGGGAIEAGIKEAELFGTALTRVDAAKVEAANDAMFRFQQFLKGTVNKLTVALAPILEAVSQKLIEMGTSGEGMGSKVMAVVEFMAKGVGKLADLWHNLVGFLKVVKVVALGLASVWSTVMSVMVQKLESLINLIPFVNVNVSKLTDHLDDQIKGEMTKSWDGLMDHLDEPMPSEGVDKFFKDVEKKADASAKKIAASKIVNPTAVIPAIDPESTKATAADKPSTVMSFLGGGGINSATSMIGRASTAAPSDSAEASELKKQTPVLKSIEQGINRMLAGESVHGAV